jgi:hypothetical protein
VTKKGKIEFCVFPARRATAAIRRHNTVADYEKVLVAIKKAIVRGKAKKKKARR